MSFLILPIDFFKEYFYYFFDYTTIWVLKRTCKTLQKILSFINLKLNVYELIKFNYFNLYIYAINNIRTSLNIPTFKLVNFSCFYGHFNFIKFFYKNGYSFTEDSCSSAAAGGHLNILKWLKKKNIKWDQWTITCAINNKNYHILNYAIKNNAPTGYFAEQALNRYNKLQFIH